MIHADARFSRSVEEAVARLEEQTGAEIVVVAAGRSGTYRDISFVGASVLALFAMLVLILIPTPVHEYMLVIEVSLTWLLAAWVLDGAWFLRLLVPKSRRTAQVLEAAHAEFHREGVHATPRRIGVLVYVSALEGVVEVLPDLGIQGKVPPARWSEAIDEFRQDDLDHFLAGLYTLGELLAEFVPERDEDIVDLPNAPRVRS
ncbi:MAG: hypothetical protein EA397_11135 [Deltaproteobacteria bacterium]|nr:MAG: hypothetical protein EA397_11135 [Deltaproteobacteria bacterium]